MHCNCYYRQTCGFYLGLFLYAFFAIKGCGKVHFYYNSGDIYLYVTEATTFKSFMFTDFCFCLVQ